MHENTFRSARNRSVEIHREGAAYQPRALVWLGTGGVHTGPPLGGNSPYTCAGPRYPEGRGLLLGIPPWVPLVLMPIEFSATDMLYQEAETEGES